MKLMCVDTIRGMEITLDVYIGADTNDDPSEATVYDVKIVDEKAFREWLDADVKDTPNQKPVLCGIKFKSDNPVSPHICNLKSGHMGNHMCYCGEECK